MSHFTGRDEEAPKYRGTGSTVFSRSCDL